MITQIVLYVAVKEKNGKYESAVIPDALKAIEWKSRDDSYFINKYLIVEWFLSPSTESDFVESQLCTSTRTHKGTFVSQDNQSLVPHAMYMIVSFVLYVPKFSWYFVYLAKFVF